MPYPTSVLLAAAPLLIGGAACASIDIGSLPQTPFAGRVIAEFVSSDAGATGSLYYLGAEAAGGDAITYASSTDANGLGRYLFSNKGTAVGFGVDLGLIDAGVTLHFAYLITHTNAHAKKGDVIRTDVAGDLTYVALSAGVEGDGVWSRVHIEDTKGRKSDLDYNDLTISLRFDSSSAGTDSVPAPGGAALAAIGLLCGVARRRR